MIPQTSASLTDSSSEDVARNLSTILTFTCLSFILIWYVQYLWKRRFLYIHSWNIPGPINLPFIGIGYLFLRSTSDVMKALIQLQKNYPEIGKGWFGPKLYYFVSAPEHIEKILTSPNALDKDYLYKFLSYVIGEGLITARGQKWKKHRKVIRPAFSQKILDRFQEVFARQAEVFTSLLEKENGNKELDLFHYVSNCTLDIICETALGLNMNNQSGCSDFGTNLDKILEITTYRIFHLWHHLEFTWNWYPMSKEYARVIKKFKNFTGSVIKKKMEEYNKNKSGNEVEKDPTKTLAFLDLILENSNFTEEELREEVNIFLIAGTDTTASSVTCLFVMLGMFPDVQQKVYEEVMDIIGPDRIPVPSDLPLLKYTERVIKESLRIFPVAAFFLRKIAGDIEVEYSHKEFSMNGAPGSIGQESNTCPFLPQVDVMQPDTQGDVVFPAGSSVFFGPVHIQRNPKYWPDPLKFDPDRFLPENVAKRHPCTYIPFSYGPRNCIGGRYAMINMLTLIAIVIRRLKIFTKYKTIEEIKLKTNVVLRLRDGPKVWVECR